jgi:SAM-dependent methyltransferase
MKDLRQRYEDVAYRALPIAHAHPGHLSALARLFGLSPNVGESISVLEIGCADGTNLRSIAGNLPNAHLLGIDISTEQIRHGVATNHMLGITNVELVSADIREHDLADLRFDYIIAHGVLSWVPDEVKGRLFQVCRDHLDPTGVAYISYNTFPGWAMHQCLMELVSLEIDGSTRDASALHQQVMRMLDDLDEALQPAPGTHVELLRTEMQLLRSQHPRTLFHDEFELVNDPCYFLQFIEWAREHKLAYVSDAILGTLWPGAMGESLRRVLKRRGADRVSDEQYVDFVINRRFRMSILCAEEARPGNTIDPAAVKGMLVNAPVESRSAGSITPKKELLFESASGTSIGVGEGANQAALQYLSANPARFVGWKELITAVEAAGFTVDDRTESILAGFILELAALGLASLSTMPRPVPVL